MARQVSRKAQLGKELAKEVRTVRWHYFLKHKFRWKQGEHVTCIGPTGGGKTTLVKQILPRRDCTVIFVTKARDPLIQEFKDEGYEERKWWDGDHELGKKILLRPPLGQGKASMPTQKKAFEHALYVAFKQGGWCVYMDELKYITNTLRLKEDVELLYHQGRSLGVSVVGCIQRPTNVPLLAYDQATHLFFWRENDERNIRRIGGLGGTDSQIVEAAVARLGKYQVLYLNTRTGEMFKTKVEL